MTLLTTEIMAEPDPMIVFAADRRISSLEKGVAFPNGPRSSKYRVKPAVIGYFGLAELPLDGRWRQMDVWLSDFLNAHTSPSGSWKI